MYENCFLIFAEFRKAQRAGEEGIIAKRAASRYYSGKRTREWLKIKTGHEQEAVIVGFNQSLSVRDNLLIAESIAAAGDPRSRSTRRWHGSSSSLMRREWPDRCPTSPPGKHLPPRRSG